MSNTRHKRRYSSFFRSRSLFFIRLVALLHCRNDISDSDLEWLNNINSIEQSGAQSPFANSQRQTTGINNRQIAHRMGAQSFFSYTFFSSALRSAKPNKPIAIEHFTIALIVMNVNAFEVNTA